MNRRTLRDVLVLLVALGVLGLGAIALAWGFAFEAALVYRAVLAGYETGSEFLG